MYEDRPVNKKVEPAWNGFYKISGLKFDRQRAKKVFPPQTQDYLWSTKDHFFDA